MIKSCKGFSNVNVGTHLVSSAKTVKISTYYDHTESEHGVTGYKQKTKNPNKADCIDLGDLAKIGEEL